jgi:hypothetical protein
MSKLIRNTSDPASRAFWEGVDRVAAEIKDAPSWMRAGITVNAQHFETYAGPECDTVAPRAASAAADTDD